MFPMAQSVDGDAEGGGEAALGKTGLAADLLYINGPRSIRQYLRFLALAMCNRLFQAGLHSKALAWIVRQGLHDRPAVITSYRGPISSFSYAIARAVIKFRQATRGAAESKVRENQ